MKVVEITADEYEVLRLSGAWVQWMWRPAPPDVSWNSCKDEAGKFCGKVVGFYTRVDDEQEQD